MKINWIRIRVDGKERLAQTVNVKRITYYCLADVLEAAGLKNNASCGGVSPIRVNGLVVWDYRWSGANLIESPFMDEKGIQEILRNNNLPDFEVISA